MGKVIHNQQKLNLEEMLSVLSAAKEKGIEVSTCCSVMRCQFECQCNCNCNSGNPSEPVEGEPTTLYVTPDVTGASAAARIPECNELIFSWAAGDVHEWSYSLGPDAATGEAITYRYFGTKSSNKGSVDYYFKRPQYIAGYEMGVAQVASYSPKEWDIYLSKDGGETWILAHSENFMMSSVAKKSWALEPGFYNAYRLDVKNTCNNSRIAVFSLRMTGLPTEVIPVNMEKTSRYGVTISSNQVTNPLNATWVFIANHYAQMEKDGYIDYSFDDVRLAKSFSIITKDDSLKGWDIKGSNDNGATWETLYSTKNQTLESETEYEFKLPKRAVYQRYRIVATQLGSGNKGLLTYFQLYR